jgi:phospholipase/lecithinase/hemolysin
MKRKPVVCLILGLLLLAPLSVFGASFDTVVVFGDSLSDNGNVYQQSGETVPDPDFYFEGRFSNGPVWAEYLTDADRLNCTLVDNAFAGAKTQGASPPGVVEQVALYVSSATLPDNALFVVWIGANDFLGGSVDVNASVANIATALDALASFGAENILILNLPDLGSTPRMISIGGDTAAGATAISQAFNAALASEVDDFQADNPDITVYELNIYDFFANVIADPDAYGLTNVTEVSPNLAVADEFGNSAGYLFWDDIHPTTEAHEEVAEQAYLLLPAGADDDDDDDDSVCFIRSLFIYN